MLSDRKRAVAKTGLLFLFGSLAGISISKVAERREHSQLLCQTRLALIGDKFGGIQQIIPLQTSNEAAILGLVTPEGPVLVRLGLTSKNFLVEDQCVRPDGEKVSIQAEKAVSSTQ